MPVFAEEVQRGPWQREEAKEWCLRLFRRLDRDLSGTISKEELDCEEFRCILKAALAPETVLCMGGPKYGRARMAVENCVALCFRRADLDADGQLSLRELQGLAALLWQAHSPRFTAELLFSLFDLNGNHRLEEGEFRELFAFYLGALPTEAQFREEWLRLDEQVNGGVSQEEFMEWLEATENPVFKQHPRAVPGASRQPAASVEGSRSSSRTPSAAAAQGLRRRAQGEGWRPWHGAKGAWEQRLQPSRSGPALSRLSSEQADNYAAQKVPPPPQSLVSRCLARSDAMTERPKWNPYLAARSPNWIDDASDGPGKPKQHKVNRSYFSRPQSLPELESYYSSHSGFYDQRERLRRGETKKRSSLLSTDPLVLSPEELCPSRGRPACSVGSMRDPVSGQRRRWNDFWQPVPQLKDQYQASTLAFRCLGKPPRHLYADLYDDE